MTSLTSFTQNDTTYTITIDKNMDYTPLKPDYIRNEMKKIKDKTKLIDLPIDILDKIISTYAKLEGNKKLLDWIDSKKLNWTGLSNNPNAIEFLKANKSKINWLALSENPNAIELLKANKSKINWKLREIVLNAVQNDGWSLRYASKELQNDREIVLSAVKKCGDVIDYVSKELQNDQEILLCAAQTD